MSYTVLARKWRPKIFSDVVGQDYVVKVLTNTLNSGRLHQVYLFSGTRGVGKTTLARIFAKALNCEIQVSSTPCGACVCCREIDQGKFIDFYEIDAASRTKVEDIRDLMESVAYPPVHGRYKVYLIDEIHMLSTHSFNALLKTLEEPPAQVVFIFATTEPQKLPITVLSRAIQFYLQQIQPEQLALYLKQVCQQEEVRYEELALQQIAKAASGSIRDALSLLDQAIVLCCNHLTNNDVCVMLGYVTQAVVIDLLVALFKRDGQELFIILEKLHSYMPNYQQVLLEILACLHKIAIKQVVKDYVINDDLLSLTAISAPETIQLYYQIALRGQQDLCYAPSPAHGFEMLLLRMLAFQPVDHIVAVKETFINPSVDLAKPASLDQVQLDSTKTESTTSSETNLVKQWQNLIQQLHLTGLTKALANHCSLKEFTQDVCVLALPVEHQGMINAQVSDKLEQALRGYYARPIKLQIILSNDEINSSPAVIAERARQLQDDEQLQSLVHNAEIIKIREAFNAQILLPKEID